MGIMRTLKRLGRRAAKEQMLAGELDRIDSLSKNIKMVDGIPKADKAVIDELSRLVKRRNRILWGESGKGGFLIYQGQKVEPL